MSFLTEYFDEYREWPLRSAHMCRPENSSVKIERNCYDPKTAKRDKEMTDAEIQEFIKKSMAELRGQSTYYNDHCAFLDQKYVDEYREMPLRNAPICRPEKRFTKIERKWYDPKKGKSDKEMSDAEIQDFIKKTMAELRGQSTYYNDHCAFLDQSFKTRPFVPKAKKKRPCKEEEVEEEPVEIVLKPPLALKDTEVMIQAKALYEKDMEQPSLKCLDTHFRVLGYIRPTFLHTGLSEYSDTICKLAYEIVRDNRRPPYVPHNGNKPRWGYPPEKERQPELDIVPFNEERIY